MAQKAEKTAPAAQKDAAAVQAGVPKDQQLTEAQKTQMAELQKSMAEDAGAGFEEANAAAYAIPFLYILQSGSPQVKKSDGAYVQGAEEGMFFNTVTGEVYSGTDGVILIPCHYAQRFIEWKQREQGGGFVAEHPPTSKVVATTTKDVKNRDVLPNGNNLVDTRNHYCLLVIGDRVEPCVISMSSTQVKKSRNWMSKMSGLKVQVGTKMSTAPMFSRRYRATTVPEKNDQGTWMGWKIELLDEVRDPDLYNGAKKFRDAVVAGRAQAVQPQAAHDEEEIAA